MQLNDIRVSRKLWGTFVGLVIAMLLVAVWTQHRSNTAMARAIADVVEIDSRISTAIRWRGATETAVTMTMGSAVTTDAVLAEQYGARAKAISEEVSKLQENVVRTTVADDQKQVLAAVMAARQAVIDGTIKTWELKGAGDSVETQSYVDDELAPRVERYFQAQDDFVRLLEQRRDQVGVEALSKRTEYMVWGLLAAAALLAVCLVMVWRLVRSVTEPLQQAMAATQAIAAGDLTYELKTRRKDEFGHMLRALADMAARLRGVVGEVRTGVDGVSAASVEIAKGNHDLSARTEQTAANLEETASSIEQMTATVTQAADTARQANQLAGTAVQAAERGGDVVQQVVQSMDRINTSSRKIGDIIGVIDGIAFQTNILALNAAVEAARAGEQGRGFAVVASEVRSLAGRSAEAAKEIKQLINDSVSNVDVGAAQVAQAGESMQEIVASVRRVTDLIGEITASSSEQRDGILQVNQAVSNLDQMTQQNAALVEESTAAAAAMSEQAQRLAQVVSVFNVGSSLPRAAQSVQAMPTTARVQAPVAVATVQTAKKPIAKSAAKPAAPAKPAPALVKTLPPKPPITAAGSDDDWETF